MIIFLPWFFCGGSSSTTPLGMHLPRSQKNFNRIKCKQLPNFEYHQASDLSLSFTMYIKDEPVEIHITHFQDENEEDLFLNVDQQIADLEEESE